MPFTVSVNPEAPGATLAGTNGGLTNGKGFCAIATAGMLSNQSSAWADFNVFSPCLLYPDSRLLVLVQSEMERGRSPLVSIPPFGRGFSRHRYNHQAIPQHGCVPAEPASVSPGKIIVAPPCPSVATVAVGTTITDRPTHRSVRARLRIRLLRRMSGVEACIGIGVQNAGWRNPPV